MDPEGTRATGDDEATGGLTGTGGSRVQGGSGADAAGGATGPGLAGAGGAGPQVAYRIAESVYGCVAEGRTGTGALESQCTVAETVDGHVVELTAVDSRGSFRLSATVHAGANGEESGLAEIAYDDQTPLTCYATVSVEDIAPGRAAGAYTCQSGCQLDGSFDVRGCATTR